MNIYEQRLRNVARATAETHAPHDFDMLKYAHDDCGTPACAFGNYAVRVDLQQSFVLTKSLEITVPVTQIEISIDGFGCPAFVIPGLTPFKFKRWWVAEASTGEPIPLSNCKPVCEHFGLTEAEALELFSSWGCGGAGRDREAVIAYFLDFCARKWPKPVAPPLAPGYVRLRNAIEATAALHEPEVA